MDSPPRVPRRLIVPPPPLRPIHPRSQERRRDSSDSESDLDEERIIIDRNCMGLSSSHVIKAREKMLNS